MWRITKARGQMEKNKLESYGPNVNISNYISSHLNMTPQLKFYIYLFIGNQLGSNYMQYKVITAYICCKHWPLGPIIECNTQPKY